MSFQVVQVTFREVVNSKSYTNSIEATITLEGDFLRIEYKHPKVLVMVPVSNVTWMKVEDIQEKKNAK